MDTATTSTPQGQGSVRAWMGESSGPILAHLEHCTILEQRLKSQHMRKAGARNWSHLLSHKMDNCRWHDANQEYPGWSPCPGQILEQRWMSQHMRKARYWSHQVSQNMDNMRAAVCGLGLESWPKESPGGTFLGVDREKKQEQLILVGGFASNKFIYHTNIYMYIYIYIYISY